jgi:LacI family transcriptional regulator
VKSNHPRIRIDGLPQTDSGETSVHFDAYDRFRGYKAAMEAAGLEPLVLTHPITGEIDVAEQFVNGGVEAIDKVLAHPGRPTAIVCYNDLEAYGLIRGARLQGISIPEQISVVGFGDLDHSRIVAPALTSVTVQAFEVGRRAAQALMDRIEDRPVQSALIECELIVRESTGKAEG